MTCQEALALLYDVIDNEASQIDLQEVREHLSHCKDCSEVYRVEQALDKLLKARVQGTVTEPEVDKLKSNVLDALDALDSGHTCSLEKKSADPTFLADHSTHERESHPRTATNPPSKSIMAVGRMLALAASIVIVIGVAFYGVELFNHKDGYSPLEAKHLEAYDQATLFTDAGVTSDVQSQVNLDLGYEIEQSVAGYEMVGARFEQVDGIDVAHFLYQNGDKKVSVFVARNDELAIPADLLEHPVVRDQIEFYDHNCRGCHLVYHTVGDLVIVTAAKDRTIDLMAFVPGRKVA